MTVISFEEKKEESEKTQKSNVKRKEGYVLWDYNDMLDTVSGDKTIAINIIKQFNEQTTSLITKLKDDFAAKDYKAVAQTAHLLKGSCNSISAWINATLAEYLENAAKQESVEKVRHYIFAFSTSFRKFEGASLKIISKWEETL